MGEGREGRRKREILSSFHSLFPGRFCEKREGKKKAAGCLPFRQLLYREEEKEKGASLFGWLPHGARRKRGGGVIHIPSIPRG